MKIRLILIIILSYHLGCCQIIEQILTGTSADLYDLSAINNNVVVSGRYDYLAKSNNGCNSLIPLGVPGPTGNITFFRRPDTTNAFFISYNLSQTLLYKSFDGCNNWVQKLNTSGAFYHDFVFLDSLEGFMTSDITFYRTIDGGSNWVAGTKPQDLFAINRLWLYGDSMMCLAGPYSMGGFGIYLSPNRGQTWPYYWSFNKDVEDVFFLSPDTVFTSSVGGEFARTFDGGKNWVYSTTEFINIAHGIFFKDDKEGYIVGADDQNNGVIVKTTNLGQSWSTFNTGIKTELLKIAFLNDSIALLTGTKGVLLRWNYKSTVFTGIGENYLENAVLKISPNPVKDKLSFQFSNTTSENLKLSISNTLGQLVYTRESFDLKEELDVSFLKTGIYYLTLQQAQGESVNRQKVFKIVKE